MQLKNLQIPEGAVFAPMAGLTDAACRRMMADHGAAWTVSEMASAKALNFGDRKSFALLKDPDPHGIYAIQLFGAEPETLAKAILLVREKGIHFDILDINMGCPAPKITSSGAGSHLLLDPPLCGAMVAAARKALGDDTPLTVKMRIGWDEENLTGPRVAAACEENGADLLVGAKRMLEAVDSIGKDVLAEYRSDVIARYLDENPRYRNVAVLLSGDVGFYSGATGLLGKLDRNVYDVNVEPGISSIVYLCAKLGTTWQDAYLTSCHGRESNIVNLVGTRAKVFTLLSGQDTVHEMCRQLFEYNLNSVSVTVGQDFGYPTERIFTGTPSQCLDESFGDLCVALIVNPTPDTRNSISIPDEVFTRGDAPMTKSEVRTLSVAKLKLCRDSVVYDIGAGTGSVSIEMALTAYLGRVYAIEREDIAADLIEINKRKFQAANLEVVRGLAPEAMRDLPAPTHAFIGGSAGNLKSIVQCLLDKNPDVRIVINSVTMETMAETMQVVKELNLVEEEFVNVTIAKSRRLGRYHLMTGQNPVYIAVVRGR